MQCGRRQEPGHGKNLQSNGRLWRKGTVSRRLVKTVRIATQLYLIRQCEGVVQPPKGFDSGFLVPPDWRFDTWTVIRGSVTSYLAGDFNYQIENTGVFKAMSDGKLSADNMKDMLNFKVTPDEAGMFNIPVCELYDLISFPLYEIDYSSGYLAVTVCGCSKGKERMVFSGPFLLYASSVARTRLTLDRAIAVGHNDKNKKFGDNVSDHIKMNIGRPLSIVPRYHVSAPLQLNATNSCGRLAGSTK